MCFSLPLNYSHLGLVMKTVVALIVGICLVIGAPCSAFALSYQYNENKTAVAAPDGYQVVQTIYADTVEGIGRMEATDMFIDDRGFIHVLDSYNGVVLVFDSELRFQKKVVFSQDGEEPMLSGLSGLYVKQGGSDYLYYIADGENKRVFIATSGGEIIDEIVKPDTPLLGEQFAFVPNKVQMDQNGNVYILIAGVYQGICVLSHESYEFITFIGGNTVESTAMIVADYIWKKILSAAQIATMRRYVPVAVANFTMDRHGYLYTVTNKSATGTNFKNEIKKFNMNGINILKEQDWGDLELARVNNILQDTSYVDVAVNSDGFIIALDGNLCRVSVFTGQGDRLFTFGDRANTLGTFDTPVAIDVYRNDIYVLDQYRQSVTRFSPTTYGSLVLRAATLHEQGKYVEAYPLWQEVLKYNAAFLLPHSGIGKAMLEQGEYAKALQSFRRADDREGYSEAYSLIRSDVMQMLFPVLAIVTVALFLLIVVLEYKLKAKAASDINPNHLGIAGKVRYTLFHPCEGSLSLAKHTESGKTKMVTAVILIAWFLASVINWNISGFIFNTNYPENFEVLLHILSTFGLFALWVISGWLVSNLIDSSARLDDLIIVSSVALIPYIIGLVIDTGLSNILVASEGGFLTVVRILSWLWSIAVLWGGMREVHELGFGKTLLWMIFTLFGMGLTLFMLILLWSLFQNVFSFASQVGNELFKMIA